MSARLQRKTKIRGYRAPTAEAFQKLTAENAALKQALKRLQEADRNGKVQNAASGPDKHDAGPHVHGVSRDPDTHPELLMRHMGRIVADEAGTERFAGSTTGVHFILSVQQAVQRPGLFASKFPDNCYRLHLLSPVMGPSPASRCAGQQALDFNQMLRSALLHPRLCADHASQIRTFVGKWSPLCPIVPATDLTIRFSTLIAGIKNGVVHTVTELDLTTLFTMVIILLINDVDSASQGGQVDGVLLHIQMVLFPSVLSLANLEALQGIGLLSLYSLLTSQYGEMVKLSGIMVQIAKSLGLHRHARRFKFSASEVEIRKRVWWWVYMFDMYVYFIRYLSCPSKIFSLACTNYSIKSQDKYPR